MKITVVEVYAPASSSLEEEINQFCNSLKSTLALIPIKDVREVMRECVGKVGDEDTGTEEVMGRYSDDSKNVRGKLPIGSSAKYNFYITNIHTQQKESRKWAWLAPGGQ